MIRRSGASTANERQLATLVGAGMPLLRGLRLLENQQKHPALKQIIGELGQTIEGGSTFTEALAQHPKVFNHLYVNMVKAGEVGGVLEVVLGRLAEFMEKAQKIKGKVRSAMVYPCAVILVAVIIPPMVIGMVDVGEQTGALPEMLMKIADTYDEEVDNAVAAMTSLLEPIMIVFLAVIVGGIVAALLLPLIFIVDGFGEPGSENGDQAQMARD